MFQKMAVNHFGFHITAKKWLRNAKRWNFPYFVFWLAGDWRPSHPLGYASDMKEGAKVSSVIFSRHSKIAQVLDCCSSGWVFYYS